MENDFERDLEAVLRREIPGYRALSSCVRLTAGASQETYRITLATDDGELLLALRRSQPTSQTAAGVGGISLDAEATLFQVAGAAGIPGPGVLYRLQPGDGLGAGFIMEWLQGETLGQRIVRAEEFAEVRPGLARQCGEILGRIHTLDWRQAKLHELLPTIDPADLVDQTWSSYRDLDVPAPMIDYSWRWLKDHLPEASPVALVHGDFRNGNLMVTAGGINAVLDWELAHLGDPVRDLGWLCVNSWRYGNSALPVGGFGDFEELLAGYRETSGVDVSREHLAFWQVFGSFWWSVTTLLMAQSWRSGETPSLERPVIGRRSSEAQMDCVNLLIPGKFDLPAMGHQLSSGTQLPMPAELLQGVAEFLKQDIARKLEADNRFLARVAANSLQIAQREFIYGPQFAEGEKQRLQELLCEQAELDTLRWNLVNRLRDGLSLDTPGLTDHLRRTVACQLAIDQPKYSALGGR